MSEENIKYYQINMSAVGTATSIVSSATSLKGPIKDNARPAVFVPPTPRASLSTFSGRLLQRWHTELKYFVGNAFSQMLQATDRLFA